MVGLSKHSKGLLVFTCVALFLSAISMAKPYYGYTIVGYNHGSAEFYTSFYEYNSNGISSYQDLYESPVANTMGVEWFLITVWFIVGLYVIWSLTREEDPFIPAVLLATVSAAFVLNFSLRFAGALYQDFGIPDSEGFFGGTITVSSASGTSTITLGPESGFALALAASAIQIAAIVLWVSMTHVRIRKNRPEPYEAPVKPQ